MSLAYTIPLLLMLGGGLAAQVTSDRLLHADREPQNWLTYGGGYASQRYSLLTLLNQSNVKDLKLKWVYRPHYLEKMEMAAKAEQGGQPQVETAQP